MVILLLHYGRHEEVCGEDRHCMPRKGIDNMPRKGIDDKPQKGIFFEFSSLWKPTFTLQFDSMDESLCKALVLGCCFVIQCIVLLMVVCNMYYICVVKLLYS